jgi:hypothetical protein
MDGLLLCTKRGVDLMNLNDQSTQRLYSMDSRILGNLFDCKTYNHGQFILMSGDKVIVVLEKTADTPLTYKELLTYNARTSNGDRFYSNLNAAHSAEILPGSTENALRIVVAVTGDPSASPSNQGPTNGALVVFTQKNAASVTYNSSVPFPDAHAVHWDHKRNCLWALGSRTLSRFSLESDGTLIHQFSLYLNSKYTIPDGDVVAGGHDLIPLSPDALLVATIMRSYVVNLNLLDTEYEKAQASNFEPSIMYSQTFLKRTDFTHYGAVFSDPNLNAGYEYSYAECDASNSTATSSNTSAANCKTLENFMLLLRMGLIRKFAALGEISAIKGIDLDQQQRLAFVAVCSAHQPKPKDSIIAARPWTWPKTDPGCNRSIYVNVADTPPSGTYSNADLFPIIPPSLATAADGGISFPKLTDFKNYKMDPPNLFYRSRWLINDFRTVHFAPICSAGCATCDEQGCTTCTAGMNLLDGKCVAECPVPGYIASNGVCVPNKTSCVTGPACPCSSNCYACDITGPNATCTRCKNAKYLDNGSCVNTCPANTKNIGTGNFSRVCK